MFEDTGGETCPAHREETDQTTQKDAAVGSISVAAADCALVHLGNVFVWVGFCGHAESAGTHSFIPGKAGYL